MKATSRVRDRGTASPWHAAVEKLHFDVDTRHPIQLITHQFDEPQVSRYDMHHGLELGILLGGGMTRYYHGHTRHLVPGEVWLCSTWEPHGWEVTTVPCQAVVLIIRPQTLADVHFQEISENDWFAIFAAPPADRPRVSPDRLKAVREIGDALNRGRLSSPDAQAAWVHLKLLETLLLLHEDRSPSESRPAVEFRRADTIVNTALEAVFSSRQFIPVEDIARMCGTNRNSFSATFTRVMGLSFSEFSVRYRVSCAARDLLASDAPAKTVAADWGFTDTSHLHRCFRRYYGCSPSAYRSEGGGGPEPVVTHPPA